MIVQILGVIAVGCAFGAGISVLSDAATVFSDWFDGLLGVHSLAHRKITLGSALGDAAAGCALSAAAAGLSELVSIIRGARAPEPGLGGAGPVYMGQSGVNSFVQEFENSGGTVLGQQITLDVNGYTVRPDLYVRMPDGTQAFVEIKTGPGADVTANQDWGLSGVENGGAVPRGANAAAAGLPTGSPLGPTKVWVIRMP